MRNAFPHAGIFAALFLLVSTPFPALAKPIARQALISENSEETQQVASTKGRQVDLLAVGVMRASWYGGGERLRAHTASGQRFNPEERTAAHRTLPLGTKARVTNLLNGRETVVTINDRGPALWTGRSLDLSRQAAVDLNMIHGGEARVKMEIVR